MFISDLEELDKVIFEIRREEKEICWELYQDEELFEVICYQGLKGRKGYKRLLKDLSYVDLPPESDPGDIIEEMLRRRRLFGIRTYMYKYGVYLVCNPGDTFLFLYLLFYDRLEDKAEKYRRSFRCRIEAMELEKKRKERNLNDKFFARILGGK